MGTKYLHGRQLCISMSNTLELLVVRCPLCGNYMSLVEPVDKLVLRILAQSQSPNAEEYLITIPIYYMHIATHKIFW